MLSVVTVVLNKDDNNVDKKLLTSRPPRGGDNLRGQVGAQRAHGRAKQRRLQRWQEVFFSSWATASTLESMRQKFQSKKTVLKI